jgi:hypothetical protein
MSATTPAEEDTIQEASKFNIVGMKRVETFFAIVVE